MNRNRYLFLLLLGLLLMPAPAAAQITVSYTFTVDTIADPDQVNANFDTLEAQALNRTGGTIIGNIAVNNLITIDGIDIGAVLGGTGTVTFAQLTVNGLGTFGSVSATLGASSFGSILATDGLFSGVLAVNNTGAAALDVAGGITAGSGNVAVVGTDGKIPEISPTIFASLSGASLTNLNGSAIASGTVGSSFGGVPAGAVMHFNLGACPAGWTDLTATIAGRYLVAKATAQSAGSTVGTALTNGEDRAVGQHTHTASSSSGSVVTDPGHFHQYLHTLFSGDTTVGTVGDHVDGEALANTTTNTTGISVATSTSTTVNNTGAVAGTNAPYVAYIACQKS